MITFRIHLIGFLSLLLCSFASFSAKYSVSYLKEFSGSRKTDSLIAACHLLELKEHSKTKLCEAYFNLALSLWNEGQFEGLEDLGINLRSIAISEQNTLWQARAENLLGNVYNRRALSQEALGAYKNAIELFRLIDDSLGLATAYSNVSVIYLDLNEDSTALPFALRALDIRVQAGNKRALSISHTNLGNLFSNMRDTAQALSHYSKALKIDYDLNDTVGISMAYTNIGILYFEGGEYLRAIPFLKKSISLDSLLNDEYNSMISHFNLGEAFFWA